ARPARPVAIQAPTRHIAHPARRRQRVQVQVSTRPYTGRGGTMNRTHARRQACRSLVRASGGALAVALTAAAAVPPTAGAQGSAPRRIYACVTEAHRTLNLTTRDASCPDGQPKVSWNVAGSKGARGPRGARGASGPAGPSGAVGVQGPAGPIGLP